MFFPLITIKLYAQKISILYFHNQITYLIDEAFNVGKGANSIISMLHHFFGAHGLGETTVHLHCDNCTGQNKNRFMMYYLIPHVGGTHWAAS